MLTIIIEGIAIPDARKRSTLRNYKAISEGAKRGEKVSPIIGHYTPERSQIWRDTVVKTLEDKLKDHTPFTGPVAVVYEFYLPKPQSKPKWKKYPDVKPDLSNLVKLLEDMMNKRVFLDDSQIVSSSEIKYYTSWKNKEEYVETEPHVLIEITPLAEVK